MMTTFVTRINVQFNALLLLLFVGLSPFTLRHNAWVVGAWRETGMLKAAKLPNGKVLLAGGFLNRQAQTEAEIYDPVTNTWTQTGSLRAARSGQTTTTLADGRVLVVGGTTGLLAFAEIYDPTVGSWVTTGNLNEARQTTDAVLLRDGRVLVAGGNILSGSDSRSLGSAELFDPATNRWTLMDPLPTTRERHSLTLLPSGLVLAAGGKNDGGTLRRADLFDPSKAMAMIPSTPSPKITAASASSFRGGSFSPESIVSVFGTQLANTTQAADSVPLPLLMGGVRVWVGNTTLTASPLYYVSPNQINFQIPAGTPLGSMTIQLFPSGLTDYVVINRVEPGLFSADSTGKGLAAAVALRIKANGEQVYEPVSRFDPTQNKVVAVPIDLSNTKEQVFLILSGSGWRNRSSLSAVTASVGGTTVEVLYAGLQGDFVGLDQANLRLPNSLAGRGNVQVQLTVDGIAANAVTISIK